MNLELARECIKNEIKTMRLASKQNVSSIVNLHEIYEQKNNVMIVMDLLEGRNFSDVINSGEKFNDKQIFSMINQLTSALNHLRSLNIVHRDIKPANIIFKHKDKSILENQLVVCDFGFATKVYKDKSKIVIFACGTPGYIAPEILKAKDKKSESKKEKLSTAVDVYALGIMLYQMLTGESPCKKTNMAGLTLKPDIDLTFLNSNRKLRNVNLELIEILIKMLEEDPQKRISANELQKQLNHLEEKLMVSKDFKMNDIFHKTSDSHIFSSFRKMPTKEFKNYDDLCTQIVIREK